MHDMPDDPATVIVTATVIETVTDPACAAEVAYLAAVTFPLACPAHSTREDVAAHIARSLSPQRFAQWITDDLRDVIVARDGAGGPMIGYALLVHAPSSDDDVRAAVPGDDVTEISKMYVLPDHHSLHRETPPAHRLMASALDAARARGSSTVWLGVNQLNERALRYYRKMGFARAGSKTFDMNGVVEHDYVMTRALS